MNIREAGSQEYARREREREHRNIENPHVCPLSEHCSKVSLWQFIPETNGALLKKI
jgi:hypothetical protein